MQRDVDSDEAHALDQTRAIGHQPFRSLCYAPAVSMYFDVRGNVIACCQNTTDVLGNVNDTPLQEIWHGDRAREMRRRLEAYEFPEGCDFCAWEFQKGSHEGLFATNFDEHPATAPDPAWPVLMEFAMSNRCNLACVMCNGDFSSTIRAQREGRPPLAMAYRDDFFAQLRPFLAHLHQARFLGGEPFLIPEYQRIWDLMIEDENPVPCNVTTNGTVRTRQTEQTLDRLPFSIGVSVDGLTKATVERIRVGADHGRLMENIRWFRQYCEDRSTGFGLTYCLMTHNWREFADFLAFADSLDADVSVNTVVYPPASSLYRLDLDELTPLLDELAGTDVSLTRNRRTWDVQLAHLRDWQHQLRVRRDSGEPPSRTFFEAWGTYQGPSMGPSQGPARPVPVALGRQPGLGSGDGALVDLETARRRVEGPTGASASTMVVDEDNVITAADGPAGRFLGLPTEELVGFAFPHLVAVIERAWGSITTTEEHPFGANAVERRVVLQTDETTTEVHTITLAETATGAATSQARSFTVAIRTSGPRGPNRDR